MPKSDDELSVQCPNRLKATKDLSSSIATHTHHSLRMPRVSPCFIFKTFVATHSLLESFGRTKTSRSRPIEDRVHYNIEMRKRERGKKNALRDNGRRRHMTSPIYHLCLVWTPALGKQKKKERSSRLLRFSLLFIFISVFYSSFFLFAVVLIRFCQ